MSQRTPGRAALTLAVLALLGLVARGDGSRTEAPDADGAAAAAVESVMRTLRANKGAVRIGMSVTDAAKATPAAANHLDTRFLPLAGSWLDPERTMKGTVAWEIDLGAGKSVDVIRAVVVTGPCDRAKLERAIVAAGRRLGLDLSTDAEDPHTWFDAAADGVELWITTGEGVVVVDADSGL
jgi:hypothetical protein